MNKSDLIEILKIRTDSLIGYSNKVWNIFNWFSAFNIVGLGLFLNQINKFEIVISCGLFHLVINILWFIVALNDFRSFKKHSSLKKNVEDELIKEYDFKSNFFQIEINNDVNEFSQSKILYFVPIIFGSAWITLLLINLSK